MESDFLEGKETFKMRFADKHRLPPFSTLAMRKKLTGSDCANANGHFFLAYTDSIVYWLTADACESLLVAVCSGCGKYGTAGGFEAATAHTANVHLCMSYSS